MANRRSFTARVIRVIESGLDRELAYLARDAWPRGDYPSSMSRACPYRTFETVLLYGVSKIRPSRRDQAVAQFADAVAVAPDLIGHSEKKLWRFFEKFNLLEALASVKALSPAHHN